ncbi:glycoside hydrolase family 25 protein [Pyxidicoccus sp. 3LFB2]
MSQAQGIDVSRYQKEVDWARVKKAGIHFAFIKATEGRTYVDPLFARNWQAAGAHGLLRGAYHFFRALAHPLEQAKHFVQTVARGPGDLPLVLDVESNDGLPPASLQLTVRTCLEAIEDRAGVKPILYTYPGFWEQQMTDDFGEWPLWIAHYGVQQPRIPRGWKAWTFWQRSAKGRVDGVEGDVDTNVFHGTPEQLTEFVRKLSGSPSRVV